MKTKAYLVGAIAVTMLSVVGCGNANQTHSKTNSESTPNTQQAPNQQD